MGTSPNSRASTSVLKKASRPEAAFRQAEQGLSAFHAKRLDPASRDGETADGSTARRSDGGADLPVLRLHLFDRDVLRHSIRQERGGNRPDPGRLPPGCVAEPRVRGEQVERIDQAASRQEIVESTYHFFRPEWGGPP